ncbi:MAG: hypothetical protein RL660_1806 [Bacteroidota bacterium]
MPILAHSQAGDKSLMKKIQVLMAVLVLASFAACTKFEEKPNFSFRSVKQRVVNNYSVESYTLNGVQKASLPEYSTQKQFWLGDGVYTQTYINPTNGIGERIDGNWSLEADGTKILLRLINTATGQLENAISYNIIKLSNKEMWLRTTDNAVEMHLKRDNS